MSTAQLDDFAILFGEDLNGFDGSNPAFLVAGETIELKAGEPLVSREAIEVNGVMREFTVRTTFVNPTLTSISLRSTDASTKLGRIDFNATVVSERIMEIEVSPNVWMTLENLAAELIRRSNPGLNASNTSILQVLRTYGFEPSGRLPMYLQHLGASQDAFQQIAEHLQSIGGRDVTEETQRRTTGQKSHLLRQIRHDDGVQVAQLDFSRADRSRSQSNSGFIGFLDASFSVFRNAVRIDAERTVLKRIIEADPTNTEAIARHAKIREMFSTGTKLRTFRNWGGVSVRENPATGETEYYAQQIPCGRFSVVPVNEHGLKLAPHRYSVWSTSAANNNDSEVAAALDQLTDVLTPPSSEVTEAF